MGNKTCLWVFTAEWQKILLRFLLSFERLHMHAGHANRHDRKSIKVIWLRSRQNYLCCISWRCKMSTRTSFELWKHGLQQSSAIFRFLCLNAPKLRCSNLLNSESIALRRLLIGMKHISINVAHLPSRPLSVVAWCRISCFAHMRENFRLPTAYSWVSSQLSPLNVGINGYRFSLNSNRKIQ